MTLPYLYLDPYNILDLEYVRCNADYVSYWMFKWEPVLLFKPGDSISDSVKLLERFE